jgi:hypothetical protein
VECALFFRRERAAIEVAIGHCKVKSRIGGQEDPKFAGGVVGRMVSVEISHKHVGEEVRTASLDR